MCAYYTIFAHSCFGGVACYFIHTELNGGVPQNINTNFNQTSNINFVLI